jgi:hypothetical protein
VKIALPQAPEFVAVASAKEADGMNLGLVVQINALQRVHIERHVASIHERADEGAFVEQMDRLGWCMNVIDVARVQIVGSQELADENHRVKRRQENPRYERHLVPLELPPHQPPLRGEIDAHVLFRHRLD